MSKYQCNTCNYSTEKKSNLSSHFESKKHKINTGEMTKVKKVYSCQECEKTFSRSDALKRHMKIHDNTEMVHDYKCLLCDKTFRDKFNLRSHLKGIKHLTKAAEKVRDKLDDLQTLENMQDTEEFFKKKRQIRDEGKKGSCVKSRTTVSRKTKGEAVKETPPPVVYDSEYFENIMYTEHQIEELRPLISTLLGIMKDETLKTDYQRDLGEFEEYDELNELKEEIVDVLKDELVNVTP